MKTALLIIGAVLFTLVVVGALIVLYFMDWWRGK